MPLIPCGNEDPIGIGLDGFFPQRAINLPIETFDVKTGMTNFCVVVTGNNVNATDTVMVARPVNYSFIVRGGPRMKFIRGYTFHSVTDIVSMQTVKKRGVARRIAVANKEEIADFGVGLANDFRHAARGTCPMTRP